MLLLLSGFGMAAGGWLAGLISAITRPPSPPASAPTFSTRWWRGFWSHAALSRGVGLSIRRVDQPDAG
jgi:hypothetical protein